MDVPRPAPGRESRRSLPWFLVGVALLAATVVLVGVEEVTRALATADPRGFGAVVVLAALVAVARGVALWRVFAVLDSPVGPGRAVGIHLAAAFASNVTPSGQAGGVPLAGLFAARGSGARYETATAGVLSVNLVGNVATVGLGLFGAGVLAATTVPDRTLVVAAGAALALSAALVAGLAGAWVARGHLGRGAVALLTPLVRAAGRLPGVPATDRETVRDRVAGFGTALDRVLAAPPGEVAVVAGAMTAAQLLNVLALWTAFRAVGATPPLAVLFAALPLAYATAVAPLPGGLGGIEAALTALVSGLAAGVDPGVAGAAVLVFRGVTFWLRTLVGGVAAAALSAAG